MALAGVDEAFEISGTPALRPAAGPAPWPGGQPARPPGRDIDPDQPIADLVEFARHPAECDSLARIPAAMIVTREGAIQ